MNENILFIDDDVNLLRSYLRQFRQIYNVQTASSGAEAIRVIKEGKLFPIIISDYSMPLMNGVEFFEIVTKISPQTIKILVTGHADISIALNAINKGNIFRFITKPFDLEVLRHAIKDALYQYKLISIEKSDLLKNEFLNIISHEIRTPLNGIEAFLQLIKGELDDKTFGKVSPYFEIIDENSNRLLRTIHLMIDISGVTSRTVEIKFDQINLFSEIIQPIINKYQEKVKAQNTTIDINMDSSEYIIISDKYCVEQIFSNILYNAILFTKNGLISITLTTEKADVLLEISDNGIGMKKDFLEKMFDPFIQEESGMTRTYDGNGLGLTLVKEYCNLLNISCDVTSKKDVGTTFLLRIEKEY